MNKVFRKEKKFLLNMEEYLTKSHLFQQVLTQDAHNGTHGYMIRSLYFDTAYDTDFYDKQGGFELRRKIRLRCYDPDADFAMLEMKQKQGDSQLKRSLRLTRAEAERMIAGDYTVLLSHPEDFALECYALMHAKNYRPKTIVQYHRKAFVAKENKIRVTFDNQIVATESSFHLFDPGLNMNPVLDPYDVVLEVKYNGFLLSYIQLLLNAVDKSELSVSKYCLARQQGCRYRFD